MTNEMILKIIEVIVLVLSFVIGRYILPKIPKSTIDTVMNDVLTIVDFVKDWAERFIILQAKINDITGDKKMSNVVDAIEKVLKKYGLEMDREEIKAIAQQVYENINIEQYENKK